MRNPLQYGSMEDTSTMQHMSRKGRLLALLGVTATLAAACEQGPTPPPTEGEQGNDRRALLASLGEHVILPAYRDFLSSAEALQAATGAYATAAASAQAPAEREGARNAWRQAMLRWQEAELYQVGPAGSSLKFMGGQNLRDEIYSWPTVNPCRVDQELVRGRYAEPGYFDTQVVNVYGLDALEYLLFHEGDTNACPSLSTINTDGSWQDLGREGRLQRRAAYAHAVASHLVASARKLVQAWEPTGGNFLAQLANAGNGSTVYSSSQVGLDEVFASMYYLELRVKDLKLAVPAGISPTCQSNACPDSLELRWSRFSKEAIGANLRGFQKLFRGHESGEPQHLGFKGHLLARGATGLAENMAAETSTAIQVVESFQGTFEESLAAGPTGVREVHAAVKRLTDDLKSQFVSTLNLSVPSEGAGDND